MSFITYLLQVSGCITLFYVFYFACLSRLTFFTVNRYYLLTSLLLSFVIPLITIPVYSSYTVITNHLVQMPPVMNVIARPAVVYHPIVIKHSPVTWLVVLKWIYAIGCILLFLRFAATLIGFFIGLRNQHIEKNNGLRIIRSNKKLSNGSFLNYIFLDEATLNAEDAEQVIAHEILHVRLGHSFDRIAGRVAQIILWFNPIMYLYARAIEQNHEFEVDSLVTAQVNKQTYAGLLLQLSVNARATVYNSFSKTPLQRRIRMLFNARSSKLKQLIYLLVLPLLTLSFVAFANLKRIVLPKALDKPVTIISPITNKVIIGEPVATTDPAPTGNAANQIAEPVMLQRTSALVDMPKNADVSDVDSMKFRYSVIKGVENLGKNPLVLINYKEYPSDILYKIGSACIRGTGIWAPDNAVKYFGPKAKDGCVKITTANGEITYQTAADKNNLIVEHANLSSAQLVRLVLQNDDGTLYDRVFWKRPHGSTSIDVAHNAKVAFFIDTTFFTEEQMKIVLPKISETLLGGGTYNLRKEKMPDGDLRGYESVMYCSSSQLPLPRNREDALKMMDDYNWEKRIPIN